MNGLGVRSRIVARRQLVLLRRLLPVGAELHAWCIFLEEPQESRAGSRHGRLVASSLFPLSAQLRLSASTLSISPVIRMVRTGFDSANLLTMSKSKFT